MDNDQDNVLDASKWQENPPPIFVNWCRRTSGCIKIWIVNAAFAPEVTGCPPHYKALLVKMKYFLLCWEVLQKLQNFCFISTSCSSEPGILIYFSLKLWPFSFVFFMPVFLTCSSFLLFTKSHKYVWYSYSVSKCPNFDLMVFKDMNSL